MNKKGRLNARRNYCKGQRGRNSNEGLRADREQKELRLREREKQRTRERKWESERGGRVEQTSWVEVEIAETTVDAIAGRLDLDDLANAVAFRWRRAPSTVRNLPSVSVVFNPTVSLTLPDQYLSPLSLALSWYSLLEQCPGEPLCVQVPSKPSFIAVVGIPVEWTKLRDLPTVIHRYVSSSSSLFPLIRIETTLDTRKIVTTYN